MAVRVATFTVTVKYDDSRIVQPGHLLGGMQAEILTWGGSPEPYKVEVSDAEFETDAQAARREALLMVGISLDAAANGHDSMTQQVFDAVRAWCDLDSRADTFEAYIELQREAMAKGFGQKK